MPDQGPAGHHGVAASGFACCRSRSRRRVAISTGQSASPGSPGRSHDGTWCSAPEAMQLGASDEPLDRGERGFGCGWPSSQVCGPR